MDAEHKRPFVAFVVVSATIAVLLGQSLDGRSDSGDVARQAAAGSANESSAPSPSAGSPANGHAVQGVTASPSDVPVVVKSIGRAPMLTARGDGGVEVSTGAVRDRDQTEPAKPDGASSEPQGQQPSETPDPTPSGEPDVDEPGAGVTPTPGPKNPPPAGPWSSPGVPPIGPGNHATPSASASGTP